MLDKNYDIIVCGGGLAGCAAAYRAGTQGLNVLLIERYGFLGGMATAGKVNVWMRYWSGKPEMLWWRNKNRIKELKRKDLEIINRGFFELIQQKLKETKDLMDDYEVVFNDEMLKIVLQELLLDANVNILYHSFLADAKVDADQSINSINIATKNGLIDLKAPLFIDATGDADLSYYSKFEYEIGREKDNQCQPMTLCFKIDNVNYDGDWYELSEKVNKFYKPIHDKGFLLNPRDNVLLYKGFNKDSICFNSTRIIKKHSTDPVELSEAEIEGKKQVKELFVLLKNNVEEFRDGRLSYIAANIGIRESRRITGHYILSEEDILSCKKFDDSIARGGYGVDVHDPDGSGVEISEIPENDYYTIPYSSCIPINSKNLLVVGRPISTTHIAHGAIRVMPITTSIGDGVGLCASFALKQKKDIREIDIGKIHQMMDKNDILY